MHDIITWSPGVSLEAVERQVIVRAFDFYKQNQAQTARSLNIDVRTLKAKLAKYKLDDESEKARLAERRLAEQDFLLRCRGKAPIGQFDNAASRPVPTPTHGLNPTPITATSPDMAEQQKARRA